VTSLSSCHFFKFRVFIVNPKLIGFQFFSSLSFFALLS
jgi:hypothetical protein